MSDGGIAHITGELQFGSSANVSSSIDVCSMGNLNNRRAAVRDHYQRFLLGEFCFCEASPIPDVFLLPEEISITSVGADATVTDTIIRVYNFDNIPGSTLRARLTCNAFPQSPAATRVSYQIVSFDQTTVIHSEDLDCVTGLNVLHSPTFAKPSGTYIVRAQAAQTVAGKSGSLTDVTLMTELISPQIERIWNFHTRVFEIGFGSGSDSLPSTGPGVLAYFDFSQIPSGSQAHIAVACYARDADADYRVRVSDISDYNNAVGTQIAFGQFTGSFGGLGNSHSSISSFTNSFSGVKVIKVTGARTGGSAGTAAMINPTFVLYY